MQWYLTVLKQYAVFNGRSGRQEFWMFTLINIIILVALGWLDKAMGTDQFIYGLYTLAILLPGLGVGIRRLHDTNRSGWWLLLGLIPLVGAIVLIVFYAQASDPGSNQYGPKPLDQLPG